MQILRPILVGFAFGWVLQKGKLGRYDVVVNVFRFTDLTVLKFLVTALAVAMLGIQALVSLGIVEQVPVAQTYLLGNLVGGLVFGAGMAPAGFCPATMAAGAGEGRLDYLIAGGLGLCTGAIFFGLTYSKVFPALAGVGNFRLRDSDASASRRRMARCDRLLGDCAPALLLDRTRGARSHATSARA